MNKTAIKNFAVNARRKLIEGVTHKAYEVGITEAEILETETFEGGFKIKGRENGKVFRKYELKQREELIYNIRNKGFEQVMEEVAYTWFNRFIALRFMEVNNYLPTGTRVLSSVEEGKTEPDIIKEALNIDLEVDREIIFRLQDSNDIEDLYKYLLIKQCNQLGEIMLSVFEKIADYTELLLPDRLLAEGSVARDLVEEIEEYDWKIELDGEEQEQEAEKGEHGIEIIGWLYQYYISEKKDEVFAGLRKNKKITKENIPAATQLFTPKWIVKYMVENSLGRLWLESHPNEVLKAQWKYYLEEAEQEPEVQRQLDELKNPDLNPEDIKILDPAMGSGHILVYAFDVLYKIYLSVGYSEREIPTLILEKNLYGLDICDRAGQLASFALLMKARSKNRRIFRNRPKMNLCSIQESNGLVASGQWLVDSGEIVGSGEWLVDSSKTVASDQWLVGGGAELIGYFIKGVGKQEQVQLKEDLEYLLEIFHDAKEYGSILEVKEIDFDVLENRIEEIRNDTPEDIFELQCKEVILEKIPPLIQQARIMSKKYDVVCTNPPYMSARASIGPKLAKYLGRHYILSKNDLFTVFMDLQYNLTKPGGYNAMINQHSWMFLSGFTRFRRALYEKCHFINMLHLGAGAFEGITGEVVQSVTFVTRKQRVDTYKGMFFKLFNKDWEGWFRSNNVLKKENLFLMNLQDIQSIPNGVFCYWLGKKGVQKYYDGVRLDAFADPRVGLATGKNDKFVRLWYEIPFNLIGFNMSDGKQTLGTLYKWMPYNKGGEYRKWYGNREFVVDWYMDGKNITDYKQQRLLKGEIEKKNSECWNREYYFKESLSWSKVSSSRFAVRYYENGFIFDVAGCSILGLNEEIYYFAGLLNSSLKYNYIESLSPTLNFETNAIKAFPVMIPDKDKKTNIEEKVKQNINLSKIDWDSFETSWDFKVHPLLVASDQWLVTSKSNHLPLNTKHYPLNTNHSIKIAFENYKTFTENQFSRLKANEEELNKIFIAIYGLQDELTPEVEDKDITISKADRERDIKSFISYAVGCMFGRYSLDEDGLIYAGGEFSDKWLVVSGQYYLKKVVYKYVSEALSRIDSMAEVYESGRGSLRDSEVASKGGDLCPIGPDEKGSSINSIKHSRGATKKINQGIHAIPINSQGFQSGIGNPDFDMYQAEILGAITNEDITGLVSRGWKNAELIDWKTIHYTLTTNHYNIVKDNIIPIADGDYFEDDILERFVEFVKISFGEETLKENLQYIAETLGQRANETSRQAIRRYFLRDFYKDHVRTYKKRPIYWLFNSGEQNAFRALIYMHRYNPSTVARVRTDYLHNLQKKYEAEINHLDILIDSEISGREKAAARKRKEVILKQIQECISYDEVIGHMANQMIEIDLDDGVKVNYAKFQGVKIPQGEGKKPLKANLLSKI